MTKQTPIDEARIVSDALADEVRAEMARRRRTANELASVLDITPHTAGKKLNGSSSFTWVELAKTASWLGMAASSLVQRAEQSARPTAVAS